jgi:hypothetical protein
MTVPMLLRRVHLYIGLLIAPSVLFFSATGAVQLFGLHEANGAYHAAPIVERLAEVHKNQRFALKERREPKAEHASAAKGAPDDADEKKPLSEMLLKWTFLAVALGLIASTSPGLYIAYASPRRTRTHWMLLAVGAVLPVAILIL